jgi:hypothetical protein
MGMFQNGGFREKESLFIIFCNLTINHANQMAKFGRCNRAGNSSCDRIT